MNTTLSKGRTVRMTGTDTPTADPHRKRVTIGTLRISSSIADIVAEKYVSSSRKFLKWQGSNAGRLSLSMRKPAKRTYVSESEPKLEACLNKKFSRFPSPQAATGSATIPRAGSQKVKSNVFIFASESSYLCHLHVSLLPLFAFLPALIAGGNPRPHADHLWMNETNPRSLW